jgi:hypothetical protein
MLVVPTLAIAAWWLWPPSAEVRELDDPKPASAKDEVGPLPVYELQTDGGLLPAGGAASGGEGRLRYRLDTAFDWRLEPVSEVAGELALRAFVFPEAPTIGDARVLSLGELARVESRGVARIAGTIEALALGPGRYTIALVVGRPGSLPEQAQAVHGSTGTDAWALRRLAIEIE